MRVSPIQARSSRRDREYLTLTLRLRDETEKKFPPISGIETRSRFIIFTLRLRDENENSLDLISFFETRPRILKVAIFPWIQAWTASLFWVRNSVTIWSQWTKLDIPWCLSCRVLVAPSSRWLSQKCPPESFLVLPDWRPAVSTWKSQRFTRRSFSSSWI